MFLLIDNSFTFLDLIILSDFCILLSISHRPECLNPSMSLFLSYNVNFFVISGVYSVNKYHFNSCQKFLCRVQL